MEDAPKVRDYIAIFRRRFHWAVWPALLVILCGLAVATFLPNIYRSEAIILIEGQQVTEALVPTTVTSYADQRIQATAQEVMSRSKILELVKKFDLYPDSRDNLTTDALVEKTKESISITPVSAQIKTVGAAQPSQITIAFSLAFEDREPKKVQQVTNELASFFLAKNLEARKDSAKGTTEFLERQVEESRKELVDLQEKIAHFKEQHLEELPEFMMLNLQHMERLSSDINNVTREIVSQEEQLVTMRNQLASLRPLQGRMDLIPRSRVLTDDEQLQQLELKLVELKSKYSEKHPAVLALEKQIELQRTTSKSSQDLTDKKEQLRQLEQELSQLRSRYSDQHPSVLKVLEQTKQLEADIALAEKQVKQETEVMEEEVEQITNPAYVSLQGEIERVQVRLKFLYKEKQRLAQEQKRVNASLQTMPSVEKQYQDLTLDYETAKRRMMELQQKLQTARVAENLEEGQLGETFTLIEPPYLPEEPYKPNRPAIILIGVVLGLGMGAGLAALKEFSDHSIRWPEEIERITGRMVLSVIPKIRSPLDRRKRRIKTMTAVVLAVCVPAAGLVWFHFAVMDLYVFYHKVIGFLAQRYYISF